MTTVKKATIDAKKFEKKIITIIKMVKAMDMPNETKKILLEELRRMHNTCLEWEDPKGKFQILPELQYTVKAENIGE